MASPIFLAVDAPMGVWFHSPEEPYRADQIFLLAPANEAVTLS